MQKKIRKLRHSEIKLESAKKLSFSINKKYLKNIIRTPSGKKTRRTSANS
jgi:hypothetical protein